MLDNTTLRTRLNTTSPTEGLGTALHRTMNVIKATWDFSVQGGAVGVLYLKDDLGNEITLPSGAIIRSGVIDIDTAVVSVGGTGTIALGLNTAADLLVAVDADTLAGVAAIVPVGTAATAVKLTADRRLALTIAVAALTAGKFDVYLDYYAA